MTSDFTLKVNGSTNPNWDAYFNDTHSNGKAEWEADEDDADDPLEDNYDDDSYEV